MKLPPLTYPLISCSTYVCKVRGQPISRETPSLAVAFSLHPVPVHAHQQSLTPLPHYLSQLSLHIGSLKTNSFQNSSTKYVVFSWPTFPHLKSFKQEKGLRDDKNYLLLSSLDTTSMQTIGRNISF